MNEKFQYRLSKNQKNEIAQNLIDILYKNANIVIILKYLFVIGYELVPMKKEKLFTMYGTLS